MKNLYLSLSLQSMKKNRALFLPYVLFGAVMFAILYAISALSNDTYVATIKGAGNLQTILGLGIPVMAISSCVFIMYISSFVLKRQKKEFGIYRILGMEKKHLVRVVVIENALAGITSIIFGGVLGIAFEQIIKLILLKLTNEAPDYVISIPWDTFANDATIFAIVYFLITLKCVFDIVRSTALNYMNESRVGEKKPKANWVGAIIGIACLAVGYYLALSCDTVTGALNTFFVAVLFVIAGTYFVFIAASVAILKIMKANKNYYYKTSNFISVSGMMYRMKRNGAGLASICILCTMVLIMLSSITTLGTSMNNIVENQFPYDLMISVKMDDAKEETEQEITEFCAQEGIDVQDFYTYKELSYHGILEDNAFVPIMGYRSDGYNVTIITQEDFNYFNDENLDLADNEIGLYQENVSLDLNSINFGDGHEYEVVPVTSNPNIMEGDSVFICAGRIILIVDNLQTIYDIYDSCLESYGVENITLNNDFENDWYCVFNTTADNETQLNFYYKYAFMGSDESPENFTEFFSKADFIAEYVGIYNGLFVIGIVLSAAFILITVMIMYYKQLLEGYEDAGNYLIMRKVGLDAKTIKKTVLTQIVTVFFLPLIVAGIHNAFAYPMISKLLKLFGIMNTSVFFYVLIASILVFSVGYAIVFALTGRKYYQIVKESSEGSEASL